uniref:ABC transporter permease n=1 Tax=Chitinophaga sp. TaxID=1869181 RepID=UPI0031DD0D64
DAFRTNTFMLYNRGSNYLYFLWPALVFSSLQQLLLLALAVSFSREYAAGTFNQQGLLGYSHSPWVLIFVKWLPYFLMSFWTIGVYFGVSICFRIPFPAHPLLLLSAQLLLVIGACLLGITYSIIYPAPLKASQLLMSIASPAFTLSGFTWPSGQAPVILAALGRIVPLTPYLQVMRMTLLQKATWQDVLPQLGHQVLLIAVYLTLAVVLLKSKIKKAL